MFLNKRCFPPPPYWKEQPKSLFHRAWLFTRGAPVCVLLLLLFFVLPLASADRLEAGFRNPPNWARPWVYWFWLNGNITREGITADLEAMKRVGIGGVLIMEVDQGVPLGPVPFASDQWRALFKHAVSEAHRLGLQVNMNNDAGWCGSGGPWVTPDRAMQKLVWTETQVTGPKRFDGLLPQPPAVANYYRDVAVLAFPTPGDYRISDIQGKAAFLRQDIPSPARYQKLSHHLVIPYNRILDLTAKMKPGGHLVWDVPEGRWSILRIGHTPTGAMNAPSPASGRGLECDKLSREGITAHFAGFMAKLIADVGNLAGKTLVATHIDSWEVGSQNWTAHFRQEFRRLRGYDPLLYLPVITGRVVESLEVSERFLWDLRQTVSDLLVENYAGHLRYLAHRHRLRLTIEAYGDGVFDDLMYAGRADEPMAEFWVSPKFGASTTLPAMVSSAHTYGKPIIGAEAFTADSAEKWLHHPGSIKGFADWAFCQGINRIVVHRYAHQPWRDYRPGMTMGPWGLHYERTQTWWEYSKPWHRYLSRCQYLLQQGMPVVDVLYLAPEGAPRSFIPQASLKRLGYSTDACPPEILLRRLKVKNGRLVLPHGMSYQVLVLPAVERMTPRLLMRIKELVDAGATVVGGDHPPIGSPSLSGFPWCDEQVRKLAHELWSTGKIITGKSVEQVLATKGVPPDLKSDRPLEFTHRRIGSTEVYFVANGSSYEVNALCQFRVSGKRPELWYPETGTIEQVVAYRQSGGRTLLQLCLGPLEAVFVLFRSPVRNTDPVVQVTRNGREVIRLAPSPLLGIRIRHALWGPAGDKARTKDVTTQVQRMADAGRYSFTVAELASEGDPAFGVVKTLQVEYEVAGKVYRVSAQDPETISLYPLPDKAPPVRLVRWEDRRVRAELREGGDYEVRTYSGKVRRFHVPNPPPPRTISGPWEVSFTPGWGAPSRIVFDKLRSWSEHSHPGIRYFSGSAIYRKTFSVPREMLSPTRRIYLDLGRVEVIAQVKLNGKNLGILWKPPFRTEVTPYLRPGTNLLEVEVVNLWVNRMIGDEHLPEDSARNLEGTLREWPRWLQEGKRSPTGRFTFTTWRLWQKDSPLQVSGLLGPVVLLSTVQVLLP